MIVDTPEVEGGTKAGEVACIRRRMNPLSMQGRHTLCHCIRRVGSVDVQIAKKDLLLRTHPQSLGGLSPATFTLPDVFLGQPFESNLARTRPVRTICIPIETAKDKRKNDHGEGKDREQPHNKISNKPPHRLISASPKPRSMSTDRIPASACTRHYASTRRARTTRSKFSIGVLPAFSAAMRSSPSATASSSVSL